MRNRPVALGVLVLLGIAQSGQAVIMHDAAQNDPAWQQEYINLGCEYNSVVGLGGYDGSRWWNAGSGVVISDHCVIGAAHTTHYQQYVIVTGNNLVSDYWGTFTTTNVTVIPEYSGVTVSPDLAIWTFSDTITSSKVKPAKLYTGSDSALLGSLGNLSGFGYYGYPSTGGIALDGAKRGCRDVISQLCYPPFGAGADQFIMPFDAPGSPNCQRLGGSGYDYDSGGGWFIDGASEPTLFGVNNWRSITIQEGVTVTGATSVSQHIDWINSVTGLPEPGTLLLLGVAATAFRLRRGRGS